MRSGVAGPAKSVVMTVKSLEAAVALAEQIQVQAVLGPTVH